MTMSADGSTVAVNGYFTDSNLNPFGFLAYADRETWLPAKTMGQKLSMDGSVFFQPLTDGIDLVDVQTGRLVNRVQLPIQLPTVYDSLVMDGADDVVAIITGNGVSTLDLSSEFPGGGSSPTARRRSACPFTARRANFSACCNTNCGNFDLGPATPQSRQLNHLKINSRAARRAIRRKLLQA